MFENATLGLVYDYHKNIENYECDGCSRDRYSYDGCSDCPHNQERIREYENKYE